MKKSDCSGRALIISLLVMILSCGWLALTPFVQSAKQSGSHKKPADLASPTKSKSKSKTARARVRDNRTPKITRSLQTDKDSISQFDFHKFDQLQYTGLEQVLPQIPAEPADSESHESGERFDEPEEAIKFYLKKRLPEGETEFPVDKYFQAQEQMRQMPQFSTALDRSWTSQAEMRASMLAAPEQQKLGTWEALGPGNIGGRTRAILIDPKDPNIM